MQPGFGMFWQTFQTSLTTDSPKSTMPSKHATGRIGVNTLVPFSLLLSSLVRKTNWVSWCGINSCSDICSLCFHYNHWGHINHCKYIIYIYITYQTTFMMLTFFFTKSISRATCNARRWQSPLQTWRPWLTRLRRSSWNSGFFCHRPFSLSSYHPFCSQLSPLRPWRKPKAWYWSNHLMFHCENGGSPPLWPSGSANQKWNSRSNHTWV